MKITWRTEWPALLLLALMFGVAWLQWDQVPARLPVHWGLDGRPNGWGPRGLGLLGMPVVAAFVYLVVTLVPFTDPRHAGYASFAGAYRLLRLVLIGFLAALQVVMIETFHGARIDMNQVLLTLVGALFLCLGGLMGRLRPNWFAGIRTPWTLSSERSWTATHAVGGRVFALCGACWLALGFVHRAWALVLAFTMLAAGMLALVVYSWVVWRSDPARHVPSVEAGLRSGPGAGLRGSVAPGPGPGTQRRPALGGRAGRHLHHQRLRMDRSGRRRFVRGRMDSHTRIRVVTYDAQ